MKRLAGLMAVVCVTAAACAGGGGTATAGPRPAPAARVRALEAAFTPMRAEASVLADVLEVDLSSELWDRVGHPAGSPFHRMTRRAAPGAPVTYVFENVRGGLDVPLRFRIGGVHFTILNRAVFRLHRGGPARFSFAARGHVAVDRGRGAVETESVEVRDGAWVVPRD